MEKPAASNAQHAIPRVLCNCLALRQAARHVTQFYDARLASFGLRTTQYSILLRLRDGPPHGMLWAIGALAETLVMDRTTLGRNLRPLERDRLLRMARDPADRRSRALEITERGREMVARVEPAWREAQATFEQAYGPARAAGLRDELHALVATAHL